uniref:Uncharacterized protein n=1 Tax=Arundo donax TaxID=35708 RepID=A0A0A9HV98_ARUDO
MLYCNNLCLSMFSIGGIYPQNKGVSLLRFCILFGQLRLSLNTVEMVTKLENSIQCWKIT